MPSLIFTLRENETMTLFFWHAWACNSFRNSVY